MIKERNYTWEEIRDFLSKELKKTKNIMTFGTIGSLNIEHDIDTIITKKPEAKSSDFYREIHGLFDSVNNYLTKKYKAKAIRLPSMSYNPELLTLSKYNENEDLAFHVMIYVSYQQIEADWNWALFSNENVKDILSSINFLIGSKEDLFSQSFNKDNFYSSMFIFLNDFDRINSGYSEKFLIEVMNDYYDFLFRKKLKLKAPIAKTGKDVKNIFYQLCDTIDELNKTK